jgi:hypothetical protein
MALLNVGGSAGWCVLSGRIRTAFAEVGSVQWVGRIGRRVGVGTGASVGAFIGAGVGLYFGGPGFIIAWDFAGGNCSGSAGWGPPVDRLDGRRGVLGARDASFHRAHGSLLPHVAS